MFRILMCVLLVISSAYSHANLVIHYMPTEDPGDNRLSYILAVLQLSLSKKPQSDLPLEFKPLPGVISFARAIHELKQDIHPNYFTPGGINIEQLGTDNLRAVDFPLDHGLLSYRICFVSPKAKEAVSRVNTLGELKKFSIGQGTNWPDVPILKANGFKVVEIPLYTSLFKMVVSNRVDLVCRGINELRHELGEFKQLGNLIYDKSFVLIYPMPYKLYFNQTSLPLIKRIEEGLGIAQQDGSLSKLFLEQYQQDLNFSQLDKRKRFYLKSGYENSFSDSYKSFIYDPFQKNNDSLKK